MKSPCASLRAGGCSYLRVWDLDDLVNALSLSSGGPAVRAFAHGDFCFSSSVDRRCGFAAAISVTASVRSAPSA